MDNISMVQVVRLRLIPPFPYDTTVDLAPPLSLTRRLTVVTFRLAIVLYLTE